MGHSNAKIRPTEKCKDQIRPTRYRSNKDENKLTKNGSSRNEMSCRNEIRLTRYESSINEMSCRNEMRQIGYGSSRNILANGFKI